MHHFFFCTIVSGFAVALQYSIVYTVFSDAANVSNPPRAGAGMEGAGAPHAYDRAVVDWPARAAAEGASEKRAFANCRGVSQSPQITK